jgi:hypothetical protein
MDAGSQAIKLGPGGIVTLPRSARKTLRMSPMKGARVTIAVEGNRVHLRRSSDHAGTRVSPKGQMELFGSALRVLEEGDERHCCMELNDTIQQVVLLPVEPDRCD